MMRTTILAAAALACAAFAVPAQAHIANSGLNAQAPGIVHDAHYTGYPHSHSSYHHRRHRHCWTTRVRVRGYHGHYVWRTVQRCGWR